MDISKARQVILTVTCKPFGSRGTYKVCVDLDDHPRVRVWDSIGQIYTVCHRLTEHSERCIIARARKQA